MPSGAGKNKKMSVYNFDDQKTSLTQFKLDDPADPNMGNMVGMRDYKSQDYSQNIDPRGRRDSGSRTMYAKNPSTGK